MLAHIEGVIRGVLAHADRVYAIDDCCPDKSGALVRERFGDDPRVVVIQHDENQGVGGAVISGYRQALADGYDIVVKIDGDGQMDPDQIPALIAPILNGEADYTKGNRFFAIDHLRGMPAIRMFGNAVLSFVNKVSSGYWNVMDPTNGFTAIHADALRWLPLEKLARRYFFESDMLFRLGTIRAVVRDVAIPARYGDEVSNLRIGRLLWDFPPKYLAAFMKRFIYGYVLRDINVGTLETLAAAILLLFGTVFGAAHWIEGMRTGQLTPSGTIMLAAISVILGVQFLLAAISFDVANVPSQPLQRTRRPAANR